MPKKPRAEIVSNAEFDLRRRAIGLTAEDLRTDRVSPSAAAKYCSGALSVSRDALERLEEIENLVEQAVSDEVERYELLIFSEQELPPITLSDDARLPLGARRVIAARVRQIVSLHDENISISL